MSKLLHLGRRVGPAPLTLSSPSATLLRRLLLHTPGPAFPAALANGGASWLHTQPWGSGPHSPGPLGSATPQEGTASPSAAEVAAAGVAAERAGGGGAGSGGLVVVLSRECSVSFSTLAEQAYAACHAAPPAPPAPPALFPVGTCHWAYAGLPSTPTHVAGGRALLQPCSGPLSFSCSISTASFSTTTNPESKMDEGQRSSHAFSSAASTVTMTQAEALNRPGQGAGQQEQQDEEEEQQSGGQRAAAEALSASTPPASSSSSYWRLKRSKLFREDGTEWPWHCFTPSDTYKADTGIPLQKHFKPANFGDAFAKYLVKSLRIPTDLFFQRRYGCRAMMLETVAAVPGMVAGMLLHLKSLRLLEHSGGWIKALLDEAENERMHLMTFMEVAKPRWYERALIFSVQAVFFTAYSFTYALSPRIAHRIVGYLEEEAVHSYTEFLKDIDSGKIENVPAPQIAIDYWRLPKDARLRDVVEVVRADEAHHRDVNHFAANVVQEGKKLKDHPAPIDFH